EAGSGRSGSQDGSPGRPIRPELLRQSRSRMHTHALRIAGLTLAAAALAACSGSSTGSRALDATRSSVSFEPPTIVAGDDAPSTLRIRVANADGGGIAGVQVSVAMPQAGGSVTQPTARTGT